MLHFRSIQNTAHFWAVPVLLILL